MRALVLQKRGNGSSSAAAAAAWMGSGYACCLPTGLAVRLQSRLIEDVRL